MTRMLALLLLIVTLSQAAAATPPAAPSPRPSVPVMRELPRDQPTSTSSDPSAPDTSKEPASPAQADGAASAWRETVDQLKAQLLAIQLRLQSVDASKRAAVQAVDAAIAAYETSGREIDRQSMFEVMVRELGRQEKAAEETRSLILDVCSKIASAADERNRTGQRLEEEGVEDAKSVVKTRSEAESIAANSGESDLSGLNGIDDSLAQVRASYAELSAQTASSVDRMHEMETDIRRLAARQGHRAKSLAANRVAFAAEWKRVGIQATDSALNETLESVVREGRRTSEATPAHARRGSDAPKEVR